MEVLALVALALLTGAESAEVLGGHRGLGTECDLDSAYAFATD